MLSTPYLPLPSHLLLPTPGYPYSRLPLFTPGYPITLLNTRLASLPH